MTLGARLKWSRKAKKMTQPQVATKLGIDFTTISKHENDVYEPDQNTLRGYAKLYGTTVAYLLGEDSTLSGLTEIRAEGEYADAEEWLRQIEEGKLKINGTVATKEQASMIRAELYAAILKIKNKENPPN